MKKIFCLITGLTLLATPFSAFAQATPFSDTQGTEYESQITDFYERDLIEGYSDGTFKPYQTINRAEFLKILFLVSSGGAASNFDQFAANCFPDVDASAWYAGYVCQSKNLGMVRGYPDGTFRPAQDITLPEAMKLLLLRHGNNDSRRALNPGEEWYEPVLSEALRLNILPSYMGNYHDYLNHKITRAEFVYMAHQAAEGFYTPLYFE